MGWSREDILAASRGETVRLGKAQVFGEVVTDSRSAARKSVFVALEGEKFDGHMFLRDAVLHGATCLLVHRKPEARGLRDAAVIKVTDTLRALGDLAHYRRKRIAPKVLAITGSNGKTTTKEMVASILERASIEGGRLRGKVLKTDGNYNNLVGLPLTLLRLQGREKVAVLELGTNRPGEIRRLAEIADPDIGLITSVAPAHLAGLRNLAGVAREKGELFRRLDRRGIAVVNVDDPWVRRLGKNFKGMKITYGKSGDIRGEGSKALGGRGMEFTLRVGSRRKRVRLKLSGEHNLSNALGAAAMAYGLGADLEAMGRGLEAVRPVPMRMVVQRHRGIGIINDAYNANPASMEAALNALVGMESRGKRIAVLGDMIELGSGSAKEHVELGKSVARRDIGRLYLLGQHAGHVKRGALGAGMEEEQVRIGADHLELATWLSEQSKKGDWLLFKGSRGLAMEKIIEAFRAIGE